MPMLRNKILGILENVRPDVDFESTENLISDEILDSFDILSFLASLTQELQIEIDVRDITAEKFDSLEKIVSLIQQYKKEM